MDFEQTLLTHGIGSFFAVELTTLQVNVGRYCNQACAHCHVDAGPHRKEMMNQETAEAVVAALRRHPEIAALDITGGAPELHPPFRFLVREARALNRRVIDRSNLTVLFVAGQEDLGGFLAAQRVNIIASLPCYLEQNVDRQRGGGVFKESIEALRLLNGLGYGASGSGLELDLVYNPQGPGLPPSQSDLEKDYKRELKSRYGVEFNRLYTITNMPIARFRRDLDSSGRLAAYMNKLHENFNAASVAGVMCRSLVSVSWDGRIFDCDFNQMLDLPLHDPALGHISRFDLNALKRRRIRTAEHCFGCTAGAGSSCTGALL